VTSSSLKVRRTMLAMLPGVAVVVLAIVGIHGAMLLPIGTLGAPDAGFVPLVESVLLAVAGAALILQTLQGSHAASPAADSAPRSNAVKALTAALLAYVLLLPLLGFLIATFLFAWAAVATWRRYRWWIAAGYALALSGSMHVLFTVLLRMSLPAGWW
jgi:putative tricarboxylic transport membrane protein